jgi:hypothetical protein
MGSAHYSFIVLPDVIPRMYLTSFVVVARLATEKVLPVRDDYPLRNHRLMSRALKRSHSGAVRKQSKPIACRRGISHRAG